MTELGLQLLSWEALDEANEKEALKPRLAQAIAA